MKPTLLTLASGLPTKCPCGYAFTMESFAMGAIALFVLLCLAGACVWACRSFL